MINLHSKSEDGLKLQPPSTDERLLGRKQGELRHGWNLILGTFWRGVKYSDAMERPSRTPNSDHEQTTVLAKARWNAVEWKTLIHLAFSNSYNRNNMSSKMERREEKREPNTKRVTANCQKSNKCCVKGIGWSRIGENKWTHHWKWCEEGKSFWNKQICRSFGVR